MGTVKWTNRLPLRCNGRKSDICSSWAVPCVGINPRSSCKRGLTVRHNTYLKLHPQTIAVASGGCFRAGQQTSEAAVIQKGLCAKGIAPERILIEDQARSTAENFTLCKHLLESREGWDETETIAFVTNDFHVARCLKIACQNRLHVVPVAAATPKHARLRCRLRECIVSISVRFSEKSG